MPSSWCLSHGLGSRPDHVLLPATTIGPTGGGLGSQAIEGRGGATSQDASLANLLAYRSLIDGVSEWPFDLSTLLRTGMVVALGVGSWLGSALMERLLGVVL